MPITADRIHASRMYLIWAIRTLAVCAIAYGFYLVTARLIFGVMSGNLTAAWKTWTGTAESHGMVRGIPLLAIGIALSLTAKQIATWVFTLPARGCPGCGYSELNAEGTCPECGFESA